MLAKFRKNNQGFSLVEMLVALTIITTTIVGIFSLIVLNIQVQVVNRDALIAAMLAQEGLEIVRNSRDENWRDPSDPETWHGITGFGVNGFTIDYDGVAGVYNAPTAYDPATPEMARLYIDSDGFYNHQEDVTPTIFYRRIVVDNHGDYIEVYSIVTWEGRKKQEEYVADTLLYDWR